MTALADRLAARTLELVNIPSESRNEAEIAAYVREAVGEPTWCDGETLWYGETRGDRPLVVLAGHLDTVPAQDNIPGRRIADDAVDGLGASDMKGGVAVMIEIARAWADLGESEALDLNLLFFPREELPAVGEPAAGTSSTAFPASTRLGWRSCSSRPTTRSRPAASAT